MSDKTAWAQEELSEVGVPVLEIKQKFDENVRETRAAHDKATKGKITVHDGYGNPVEVESPHKNAVYELPVSRLRAHINAHFTDAVIRALVEDAKRDLEESIVSEYR